MNSIPPLSLPYLLSSSSFQRITDGWCWFFMKKKRREKNFGIFPLYAAAAVFAHLRLLRNIPFLQRVDALHKLLWNFSFTLLMNYSTRKNLHIFFALSWNLNSLYVWTLPHYTATTIELPPRHGAKLFLAFYNHLFDSIHRRDGVIRLRSTMHYFISNTIRACYYIWGNMWSVRACNSHPMIFIRVFFLFCCSF